MRVCDGLFADERKVIEPMELTRRTVLVSFVVIGLAAAAAGAGTMALFSDTETSNDNVVQAGTLDLTVNGGDQNAQIIDVTGAAPGDNGTATLTLQNNGSVDGSVDFSIDVTEAENGINDPESDVDSSENEGELADELLVSINTSDGARLTANSDGGPWINATTLEGDYDQNLDLPAGDSVDLVVDWKIPESAGDEIQTDSVTMNATIELNQQDSQ